MPMKPAGVTFKGTVKRAGSPGFIELPFDPKEVFGKVRAPVTVTLNDFTFRTTIASMGGPPCIGIRTSYLAEAGLQGGEQIDVRVELDTEKREVKPPADLVKALKGAASMGAVGQTQFHAPARVRRGGGGREEA
jgi:hypothetical protein